MIEYDEALSELATRFGRDSLIAVATMDGDRPSVRTVNGYYEDGAFYVVTYALSNKVRQIDAHPVVGLCGDWFTAHGVGENLGHVLADRNTAVMAKIREAFDTWYSGGHVDENDPRTCLVRVRLTDGVLTKDGTRYEIDFASKTVRG